MHLSNFNNEIDSFKQKMEEWDKQQYRSGFPSVTKEELLRDGVIVYGCGPLGIHIITSLLECGVPISWIVDKNPEFQFSKYMGLDILPLESFKNVSKSFVMLASTHIKEMSNECIKYNIEKWILPASVRNFCHILGEIGICDNVNYPKDDIISGFSLMCDNKSREIYKAFLKYHLVYDNDFSEYRDYVTYFPDDILNQIDYSFMIDAGAYTGDTLKDWIIKLNNREGERNYYAFEPSTKSFVQLRNFVNSLPYELQKNIHINNIALGGFQGHINILGDGGSAVTYHEEKVSKHVEYIPLDCIDNLFESLCPTFIKADIEGTESELLSGAEKTIKRCRPTLAISVYHRFSDLWTIPKWISDLDCGYKIYMRHFNSVFTDTVCFAIAS